MKCMQTNQKGWGKVHGEGNWQVFTPTIGTHLQDDCNLPVGQPHQRFQQVGVAGWRNAHLALKAFKFQPRLEEQITKNEEMHRIIL
jgi:hypothetical protein